MYMGQNCEIWIHIDNLTVEQVLNNIQNNEYPAGKIYQSKNPIYQDYLKVIADGKKRMSNIDLILLILVPHFGSLFLTDMA